MTERMTIEKLAEIIATYGWNHILTQCARARYYYDSRDETEGST